MNVTLTTEDIVAKLCVFRDWVKTNCKGRERGEAQVFLDRFFQCFGHGGVLDSGATFELAQKASSKAGNTGFLDCLFPSKALIEMKQRGTNLNEHYNQLLTYWTYCVPKPTVGILCNFDEFWIYDFNVQVDTPVQILTLDQLNKHPEALRFMWGKMPDFGRNLVDITEDAAAEISKLYHSILERRQQYDASEEDIQRFVLQCVLCLFAEDIGLLPEFLFTNLLKDCIEKPEDSYNLLHSLFSQMNTKKPAQGGRFKGVRYFNGGLFNTITPIELDLDELNRLYEIGHNFHWANVRPSIFGSIFEKAIGHHQGSHFTSEVDIYKIVNPTIVRYWDDRIEQAGDNIKKLKACLVDIRKYKVLDPACGSGNFLYIAYQEMKRLEKQIMDLIKTHAKMARETIGTDISLVSPMQFYGIEIKPFAVELARLTLEVGRKVAVNKFNLTEDVLPLDNLNGNIVCEDALFTNWPEADAIVGNPPFIGKGRVRNEISDEYIEKLWKQFPNIAHHVDFCVYWFRLAHLHSAQRIGLVGTNSVSQGQSREASLAYILNNGGLIHSAISSQEWSGDAVVHVSIVNWIYEDTKIRELNGTFVKSINSSLKSEFDVTVAPILKQNKNLCFQGVIPLGRFEIPESLAYEWIKKDKNNQEVLKIFVSADDLTDKFDYKPTRWIIDFNDFSIEKASTYKIPFEYIKMNVKPQRDKVKRQARREKWWQFGEKATGMRKAIQPLTHYISMPGHSKWFIPVIIPGNWLAYVNSSYAIASNDFYLLAVLTSKLHRDWIKSQCSTLKSDTRYTNTTCFETFPFLWESSEKLKQSIKTIMVELDTYRIDEMATQKCGITKLYNTFFHEPASKLSQLHRKLDKAVCEVYGWKYDPEKNYNENLFYLNQKMYEQEQTPLLAESKTKRTRQPKGGTK